jgi:hypothetical protein
MRIDLAIHIASGAVGIVVGFIALFATKGERLHRKAGIVFVYAMITMGLMGSMMAAVRGRAPAANIPVGLLTAYLAYTGLVTVRPPFGGSRRLDIGMMLVALGVALEQLIYGVSVLLSPTGLLYGMPAYPFLIFGAIAFLAVRGDLRLVRAGGVQTIRGVPRLTRHLWRVTTALLIAAFSFFLGQAKVIPKPIRIFPLLIIPPLVVLAALLYWLWRIRFRRSLRGIVGVAPTRGSVRLTV